MPVFTHYNSTKSSATVTQCFDKLSRQGHSRQQLDTCGVEGQAMAVKHNRRIHECNCLLVSSREDLRGLGEGGGDGKGVVTWGSAKEEDLESLSQVIWLYSSLLANWMSSLAPLPKASSMPASFFTRLHARLPDESGTRVETTITVYTSVHLSVSSRVQLMASSCSTVIWQLNEEE